MGIGPQNLGSPGMSSKSHPCGSPLNKLSKEELTEIRKEPGMSNAGKYPGVTKFAGPDGTYPINTIDRARSALSLAHNAKDPGAIRRKVYEAYPSLDKDKSKNA